MDGELNVLLRGNRLEISADVDRAGLQRLKEILDPDTKAGEARGE
jgi:hypothetical protein